MLFLHTNVHDVSLDTFICPYFQDCKPLLLSVLPNCVLSARYIGKADSITISVWNHKKIHKKQGAGFLGCVRLLSNAINRLKDTGCRYLCEQVCTATMFTYTPIFYNFCTQTNLPAVCKAGVEVTAQKPTLLVGRRITPTFKYY